MNSLLKYIDIVMFTGNFFDTRLGPRPSIIYTCVTKPLHWVKFCRKQGRCKFDVSKGEHMEE